MLYAVPAEQFVLNYTRGNYTSALIIHHSELKTERSEVKTPVNSFNS